MKPSIWRVKFRLSFALKCVPLLNKWQLFLLVILFGTFSMATLYIIRCFMNGYGMYSFSRNRICFKFSLNLTNVFLSKQQTKTYLRELHDKLTFEKLWNLSKWLKTLIQFQNIFFKLSINIQLIELHEKGCRFSGKYWMRKKVFN